MDDTSVVTSQDYVICYIDPADGKCKTATVAAGEALTTFITALIARGCQTIEYIMTLVPQDCDGMKKLFPSSVANMGANDYFLGTKAGNCARILPTEAFLQMLFLGQYDQNVIDAFCTFINLCQPTGVCDPYTVLGVQTVPYDQACPTVLKFGLSSTAPLTVSAVAFANAPNVAQTIYVEYRKVGTSLWIAGGSSLTDTGSTLGALLTPVVLAALTEGDFYNIRVYNGCQSPPDYVDNNGAQFQQGTVP